MYENSPFSYEQADSIRASLASLIGLENDNHQTLVETFWQQIKQAALKAEAAINLDSINIATQKRAGQKLLRIGKTKYPRYSHDAEIMALLYLGATRNGYITKQPKRFDEDTYRKILFELSPDELRESAVVAYNAGLTTNSNTPIIALDQGGRPNGQHYLDYAKSILTIYKAARGHKVDSDSFINDSTADSLLAKCFNTSILSKHPYISIGSLIEHTDM